jgi:hypothetical protein
VGLVAERTLGERSEEASGRKEVVLKTKPGFFSSACFL